MTNNTKIDTESFDRAAEAISQLKEELEAVDEKRSPRGYVDWRS